MNNNFNYLKKEFKNNNDFNEWYEIVKNILLSDEFLKRRKMKHHEKHSVYDHSVLVSISAFYLAKKHNLNIYNCTIAGILHDFYTEAWQYSKELEELDDIYKAKFLPNKKKKKIKELHAFNHGNVAGDNALKYYPELVNKRIVSAIRTHMFPLTLLSKEKIPKYKESWIITLADKKVTFKDFPSIKEIPKYLGIRKNKGVNKID